MQEHYIDTPEQLRALCDTLRPSPWLALDTEFLREQQYYSHLCLIQIANESIAACIDPLAIDDLSPLAELIFSPNCVKVFHAARQDLEIFHRLWGRIPEPLFDSQLAATMLGLGDQIGYGLLIQQVLKVDLPKDHSRTDWTLRPLSDEQLRYAIDDVIYLGQAYVIMAERLRASGRLNWLDEDFAALADPGLHVVDPNEAWRRIKGFNRLRPSQLVVLKSLAAWREVRAQEKDKPRPWIMKDDVLLELARRQPEHTDKLEHIRGLEKGTIRKHGSHLLALIREAQELPREQWPQLIETGRRLEDHEEALADVLMGALRLRCQQHRLSPGALTNRKTIERLICGERDLSLLHGWRHALVGADLILILEGRLSLKVAGGTLSLVPS